MSLKFSLNPVNEVFTLNFCNLQFYSEEQSVCAAVSDKFAKGAVIPVIIYVDM